MFKNFWHIIVIFIDKIKDYLIAVILLAIFLFLVSFAGKKASHEVCKGIIVRIISQDSIYFISENDIIKIINSQSEGSVISKNLSSISFKNIENVLNHNGFIRNAEVYSDLRGILYADIYFKKPILQLISPANICYLDEQGKRMPVAIGNPVKTIVASGYIENTNPLLEVDKQLYDMAMYINKDEFLKALIGQIYVKEDGELLLYPKIGNLIIEFGIATDLQIKFDHLAIFFKNILPYEGWNKYSKVNLKYNNQLVLNKRQNE